jgi:predicted Zn-dependent peptidase
VSIYQIDAQHTVPSVAKPQIDPVMIDASRQSDYAANLLSMPVKPIEPIFVELDVDYQKIEFRPGIDLYYAPNPLNDLFSFSVNVDVGTEESSKLGLASALLEVAGTNRLSNEQLQKEWYQSGSTFSFGSGENQSSMRLSGLDDQFENSLVTALEVIQDPNASEAVLRELKTILLKSRDDLKSSPQAISRALYLYNRYGNNSPMLAGLTRDEIVRAELRELLALPSSLLSFEHSLSYTGSLSLQQVIEILTNVYPETSNLTPPPPYRFRETVKTESNRLYVVDQKTAQAQVRIEFPDDIYERADTVLANVYTNYFGSGMSSVVFQELREARALAYSASARYSQGARVGAENLMLGAIGTQTDKTVDALDAFVELIDNMPQSTERFEESVNSLLNRYRTAKIGFRDVIGAVRSWERLGIDGDPREQSYKELQSLEFVDLAKFQESHVANKPKLFSVVGDLSIIDVEALEQFGEVTEIQIDDIFIE